MAANDDARSPADQPAGSDVDPPATLDTVVLAAPVVIRPLSGMSAGGGEGTTFASPVEALGQNEIARMRIMSLAFSALGLFGFLIALLAPADPVAKRIYLVATLISWAPFAFLYLQLRDPARYKEWIVGVAVMVSCLGQMGVLLFFGAYSAAPMIYSIAIYAYSLGATLRWSITVVAVLSLSHIALVLLLGYGVVVDRALVRTDIIAHGDQLLMEVCIHLGYAGALVLGRISRARTLEAMSKLDAAVRQIAGREALLVEARQDMEQAAGLGRAGRFTEQLVGSFRLGVVIGRGAMGDVYQAEHTGSGEVAAVKLLRVDRGHDYSARFAREMDIVSRLNSPHVVRVLEVAKPDGPFPYLVMEMLRGYDLATILRAKPRFGLLETIDLVRQIGSGLEAAWAADVVHRDLKPQNVHRADGEGGVVWKILDFGVSKFVDQGGTLTQDGIVGTPAYMAPEQASGKNVDSRADLYALGAIAYRALVGRPPFSTGADIPQLLYRVVHKMPPRPSETAELPEDVDHVLAIALAKRPQDRFATPAELADALHAAGRERLDDKVRSRARALIAKLAWSKPRIGR